MTTTVDGAGESAMTPALFAELDTLGHDLATGDIVVGAEYGISAYQAVRWAALIAQARRRRLRIVRVVREVDWLLDARPPEELIAAGDHLGRAVLADYTSIARSIGPDIDIRTRLSRGSLYTVLMGEAKAAGLLVLGAGNDYHAVAGERAARPVADWFIQHAPCPVLVVDRLGHEVRDVHRSPNEGHVVDSGSG